MPNKFSNNWIIEDELYLTKNRDRKSQRLAIRGSDYLNALLDYGVLIFDVTQVMELMEKFYEMQKIYYYMYQRGYLENKSYISCNEYNPSTGVYSFRLDLNKMLNQTNIIEDLQMHFQKDTMCLKYCNILITPIDEYRCKYCGALNISQSRLLLSKLGKRYSCEQCNKLTFKDRKVIYEKLKHDGTCVAISKRDSMSDKTK